MQVHKNYPLQELNTFGIAAAAKHFAVFNTIEEAKELTEHKDFSTSEKLILGGGSNILFTGDFNGMVLKNNIKGIELVKEDDQYYYVRTGAGEIWHEFVMHCIRNNYAGIENLSLIPGNVGASPMQNIGAYGVEIKDVFHSLEALEINSNTIQTFNNTECNFGYRESVFKRALKNRFIILSVTYRLTKQPVFNTSYGAIEKELENMGISTLSIAAISKAVCNIRSSKLPDPAKIGNAGSFFKNPVVNNDKYNALKNEFPAIVGYTNSETETKLAAGWLIEQCGWKGQRFGDAGVHINQALVLVNYGKATGAEIFGLSTRIIESVKERFGVELEREVNII